MTSCGDFIRAVPDRAVTAFTWQKSKTDCHNRPWLKHRAEAVSLKAFKHTSNTVSVPAPFVCSPGVADANLNIPRGFRRGKRSPRRPRPPAAICLEELPPQRFRSPRSAFTSGVCTFPKRSITHWYRVVSGSRRLFVDLLTPLTPPVETATRRCRTNGSPTTTEWNAAVTT